MTRSIQGSDVFLKEDVRSVLQAILITNDMLARQLPSTEIQTYRAGFSAAIAAVAMAFDIRLVNHTARGDYLGADITGGA